MTVSPTATRRPGFISRELSFGENSCCPGVTGCALWCAIGHEWLRTRVAVGVQ